MLVLTAGVATAEGLPNPLQWLGLVQPRPTPTAPPAASAASAPSGAAVAPEGIQESFAAIARAAKAAVVNVSTTQTIRRGW